MNLCWRRFFNYYFYYTDLSLYCILSINRRDTDLMDGPLGGLGIGWMVALKELSSTAQCPSGDQ